MGWNKILKIKLIIYAAPHFDQGSNYYYKQHHPSKLSHFAECFRYQVHILDNYSNWQYFGNGSDLLFLQ